MIMAEVTPLVDAQLGAFFLADRARRAAERARLRLGACYGYAARRDRRVTFAPGEGLVGQAALSRQRDPGHRRPTGLADRALRTGVDARPADSSCCPVLFEGEPLGRHRVRRVDHAFSELHLTFLERLVATIGVALNDHPGQPAHRGAAGPVPAAGPRAAGPVGRAAAHQRRAGGEGGAAVRAERATSRLKNREIELARLGLEEKAQQLAPAIAVQVGVPGQHEPRAAHPAQLAAAAVPAAGRQPGREPDRRSRSSSPAPSTAPARTCSRLIDDILDLSKIEAGRMDVEPAEVALRRACAPTWSRRSAPQAEEKGLELRGRGSRRTCPRPIVTDAQRLQQILRNLLSNAVKFTDAGIGHAADRPGAEPGTLYGVPALDAARAGRRVRGDATPGSASRRQAGADLRGVPAGRRHDQPPVRRHRPGPVDQPGAGPAARRRDRGVVRRRAPGRCSRCSCPTTADLDAAAGAPPRVAAGARPMPPSTGRRPRAPILRATPPATVASDTGSCDGATVLIVDDDVRNVFALTSALELHGMTVLYADNGADGIRLLAEHPEVDIVLMDAMMPEHGRQRDHPGDPAQPALRRPADRVPDREGDAGRPGVGLAAGRQRLHHQAGRPRRAARR